MWRMSNVWALIFVAAVVVHVCCGWRRAEYPCEQRLHSTSSQPRPPLRHCPMVGEGCAGPHRPPSGSTMPSASARSASRMAFCAASRAPCARIFAPMIGGPLQSALRLRAMPLDLRSGTRLRLYRAGSVNVLVWTASHPHGSMALSASQLDERKV
jgi:hypothetical protein